MIKFRKPVVVVFFGVLIFCFILSLQFGGINYKWLHLENFVSRVQLREKPNIILSKTATCAAEENVVFLKTHKTGSSSVQNIFMRYGVTHYLLVVLPAHLNYFGHPAQFRPEMAPKLLPGFHYNIFTHHTRFSYEGLMDLMPSGTKFVTTLREPAALFESVYAYYYLPSLYNMSLEQFVGHDYGTSTIAKLSKRVTAGRIGRNQMAFDLGIQVDQFEDEEEILRVAQELDRQFDLVMITERMVESLVLLKHLLCWTTDDVVTFNANARTAKGKIQLTPELRSNILKWNKADWILYNYFWKRFEERVNDFGREQMALESVELTNRMEELYEYCIAGKGESSKFADNVLDFKLKNSNNATCRYLAEPEMSFSEKILSMQKDYYL